MSSLKVRIKITNKCEGNCWYCLSDEKNNEEICSKVMFDTIIKMKQIFDKGNFKRVKFSLTGGNPFNTHKIIQITKFIKYKFNKEEVYIVADVCSHANLKFVDQFKKLGGTCLLSLNEDPLDKIIDISQKIGFKNLFLFNVLLTKYNIKRMPKIIDAVVKYKLPLRLNHLFDPFDYQNLIPEMKKCVDYVYPRLKKEKFQYNIFNYPFGCLHVLKNNAIDYCGFGRDHYFIDVHGNVRRCQMTDNIGTIYDNNLEDLIKYTKPIYDEKKCNSCIMYSFCKGGCPYTNMLGIYCDLQFKICEHLIDMVPKVVSSCMKKDKKIHSDPTRNGID